MFEIVIPGEPHAQGRARAVPLMRNGEPVFQPGTRRPIIQFYDPPGSKEWKKAARTHMLAALAGAPPFSGPVSLQVVAYFSCPRSQWRKLNPRPARWHSIRPDGDNCLKAVKDAAKGVLWLDDSQVSVATVEKVIAAQGEAPRTVVVVRPLAALELVQVPQQRTLFGPEASNG
ncbi:MAG: RusA family crossover junction endodeoxyribonuclease [Deltaproteobacteria bacterium]|nr:RusA family crossover junction endodeoxyribonuclease [Deltaproteobacteria bacterium]